MRRTPAAGSTARTCSTPVAELTAPRRSRQAAALLQPSGFRRRRSSTPPPRLSTSCPSRSATRRRLVFVTHSIPTAMAETRPARTAAPTSRSTATWPRLVADAVPRADRASTAPWELVYCSRSGPPHDRLARARRQRPPRAARAATGPTAVVLVPIGFVSDHMEVVYDLDTEAAATAAEARPARSPGPPRRAPIRASSRVVRDLLVERAAVERRRTRPTRCASVELRPDLGSCALPSCCPNPRGCRTGALPSDPSDCRSPLMTDRARAARRWRRPRRARPGELVVAGIGAAVEVADDQVQPDRRRHRRRHRVRGADPGPHPGRAPDDGFLGEEGDDIAAHVRRPLDRRPDRRHRQLPLRHPQFAVSIAAEVDGRGGRGRRARPDDRARRSPRSAGGGAWLDGEPIRGVRRAPICRRPWSAPASTTGRRARRTRPPSCPGCCPPSATSGGWDRPPSTSASSPADGSTPTSSAASSPGTWRRPSSSSRRRAAGSKGSHGSTGRAADRRRPRVGIYDAFHAGAGRQRVRRLADAATGRRHLIRSAACMRHRTGRTCVRHVLARSERDYRVIRETHAHQP